MLNAPQELPQAAVGGRGHARQSLHVIASRAGDVLNGKKQDTEVGSQVFGGCPRIPAHRPLSPNEQDSVQPHNNEQRDYQV